MILREGDIDRIYIKAYNARGNLGRLQELLDYVIYFADEVPENELKHLYEMFGLYVREAMNDDLMKFTEEIIMQYKSNQFDPEKHEQKKALTVKQPYAEYIARGQKTIEVRTKDTKHRGELVICSSQQPEFEGMMSGAQLALVNLYQTKPLEELTPEEWEKTCIPPEEREGLTGFGWFLKDVTRIVEYPVKGQLGIWNLVRDKLEFIPYGEPLMQYKAAEAQFDRSAVKRGALIIMAIFVLFIFLVWGVLALLF